MKLLTLNTHSLIEPQYREKLDVFVKAIARLKPDIIAMQEVNQSRLSKIIQNDGAFPIRQDNHALSVVNSLSEVGIKYNYVWQGIKYSYGIYEEGIAILSLGEIEKSDSFYISKTTEKKNWKTRMALGILVNGIWYYSTHTGRGDDKEEPFANQLSVLNKKLRNKDKVWLMGDFNCPDNSDEYKSILNSGWYDTFDMAKNRDDGYSVTGEIDGWRDKKIKRMRIDYIFTNYPASVMDSQIVFNGENYGVISDHCGVLISV